MRPSKVTVTLDRKLLQRLDRLVKSRAFANRSEVVQLAIREQLQALERKARFAAECEKLDPVEEQALAAEGLAAEAAEWPAY